MGEVSIRAQQSPGRTRYAWAFDLLLIAVLLAGAYFRFVGLNWDQNQHLHPDERFMTMVESAVSPVKDLGQYFDTKNSPLNPNNRGYGFYVYGDLPLVMVRYAGEYLGKTGYDQIYLVGRFISGLMDLGTVLMVYLIATRLYRKRLLSLIAAAFAAFSVLPIQLSHYFTVDTFTNFFGMLAFFFAVWILPIGNWQKMSLSARKHGSYPDWITREWASVIPYAFFGLALGLAMASKINAIFLAALLPGAVLIRYFSQPPEERKYWVGIYLRNLVIGGIVSVIAFRIFMPYAFSGPGFLGVLPNQSWVDQMRALEQQSTGDVDFPPALQWARRPLTFAFTNMVEWGLGLPLGLLAWAGFLWMGYRILRGEWRQHLLIWCWTGLYFAYESYTFVRSMRYQMLVYPTLAIIAAWAVAALWEKGWFHLPAFRVDRVPWARIAAVMIGVVAVSATAAWAFAFTRIYTRPVTRVAASSWIYQNVPGPINLHIQTSAGQITQPAAFQSGYTLQSGADKIVLAFHPRQAGKLAQVTFTHLGSPNNDPASKTLVVALSDTPDGNNLLANTSLTDIFSNQNDPLGSQYAVAFPQPVVVDPGKTYYLVLMLPQPMHGINLSGSIAITIQAGQNAFQQQLPAPVNALRAGGWYQINFTPASDGLLNEVVLDHVVDWESRPDLKTLRVSIIDPYSGTVFAAAEIQNAFLPQKDIRGASYTYKFDKPVSLSQQHSYAVRMDQIDGPGALAVYGSAQANESSWDDALPLGLGNFYPYDNALNFEMYWDDNAAKLQRFESILDQADYLYISSNRQWGTTVRVPERYPLTTQYYRYLLGCPADKAITWCYSVAQPGMFQGKLGYDLVAVFQSDPNLGSLHFNDQFAEEAFTVYDHPKVLIFRKNPDYNPDQVSAILGAVDLSKVIHLTPRKASAFPGNLALSFEHIGTVKWFYNTYSYLFLGLGFKLF